MNTKRKPKSDSKSKKPAVYGDPEYNSEEDIYNKDKKVFLDGEGTAENTEDSRTKNNLTGSDLDIPGAELDDADEKIGEEDEENNYYSLGGDNHDNLEEDNG